MRLKTKFKKDGTQRNATVSITNVMQMVIKNGQLIFYIRGVQIVSKLVIDPTLKKVFYGSWRTMLKDLCENEVERIRVEIGTRKYDFIDFSEDEIQELIKGEGLE